MALVLTMRSGLMCPHGGIVNVIPATVTAYRVDGYRPLLLSDTYLITGCPFSVGGTPFPCQGVTWLAPSTLLMVKGTPVLTSSSVGMTVGASPSPVITATIQSTTEEPSDFTNIDY